ncbi:MAG: LemA family protein [Gammaproteobacteria bacterium]|nr:LemA family protein [Gammaproteobacteria bacterium]
MKSFLLVLVAIIVVIVLGVGSTYNSLIRGQQAVESSWAQVQNVYQRRLDLIPNLVATVKGYAAHEKSTFLEVTQARAAASQPVSAEVLNDPQKFAAFQAAQGQVTSALSHLLVTVERYPDLKANQNFLALQAQLEGTENRIAVERSRFNETVQSYNNTVITFPTNVVAGLFGFKTKAYFQADAVAAKAPVVSF